MIKKNSDKLEDIYEVLDKVQNNLEHSKPLIHQNFQNVLDVCAGVEATVQCMTQQFSLSNEQMTRKMDMLIQSNMIRNAQPSFNSGFLWYRTAPLTRLVNSI